MDEEINAYIKYLLDFGMVKKPIMPKFDVTAYTDNEYLSAIFQSLRDFDFFDDEYLTVEHLRGD